MGKKAATIIFVTFLVVASVFALILFSNNVPEQIQSNSIEKERNKYSYRFAEIKGDSPKANGDASTLVSADPEKTIDYSEYPTISKEEEKIYFNKKFYKDTTDNVVSSRLVHKGEWYPDGHPLKDEKKITLETEILLSDGTPISVRGSGLIFRDWTGSFFFDTDDPDFHIFINYPNEQPTLDLSYSTEWEYIYDIFVNTTYYINVSTIEKTYERKGKNVTEYQNISRVEKIEEYYKVPRKVFINYIPIAEKEIDDFRSKIIKGSRIYLDPDIDACGSLTSSGTYTLNSSITTSGTCFSIEADDIILNGNGFTINGDGTGDAITIFLQDISNFTLKNLNVSNFGAGVYLSGGITLNYSRIFNNTFYQLSDFFSINLNGLFINSEFSNNLIDSSSGNAIALNDDISNSTFADNIILSPTFDGINTNIFADIFNLTMRNNTITNAGGNGMFLDFSAISNSKIENNTLTDGSGFGNGIFFGGDLNFTIIRGNILEDFSSTILYFNSNVENSIIDSNFINLTTGGNGIFINFDATNISLSNNQIFETSSDSINANRISNSVVQNNIFKTTSSNFITLNSDSENTLIKNNSMLGTQVSGITFSDNIRNFTIIDNTINVQDGGGSDSISFSSNLINSTISNNHILNSTFGTAISISGDVTNSTIKNNLIEDHKFGITLFGLGTDALVKDNVIRRMSDDGISISGSQYKIINNTIDAVSDIAIILSSLNLIENNTIKSSNKGMDLSFTSSNIINLNNFDNNTIAIFYTSGSGDVFTNNFINNTRRDALLFDSFGVFSNEDILLQNMTIRNTNASHYDLNVSDFMDNTNIMRFVDSSINNYTFFGNGTVVQVKSLQFGDIRFLQQVNGSGSNFSNDIRVGNNSATVLSDINVGLNKSAEINLIGLRTDRVNPVIRRDSVTCPANICTNLTSLNAGNVKFNVTGWTNYSIFGEFRPIITNLAENQSFALAGQSVNFSAFVSDDVLVDRAWFSNNFDLIDTTSIIQSADTATQSFGNVTRFGQSFAADPAGNQPHLKEVCFTMFKSSASILNDVEINVYDTSAGVPIGSNLTSPIIIPGSSVSTSVSLICGNFTNPPELTAGVTYAVTVHAPTVAGTGVPYRVRRTGNTNPYTAGTMVRSTNSGTTWTIPAPLQDLDFVIRFAEYKTINETKQLINAPSSPVSFVKQLLFSRATPFTYSWYANDSVGLEGRSILRNYFVFAATPTDVTSPNTNILSPNNGTKVNGVVNILANATDNLGVDSVSFQKKNSTDADFLNITGCINIVSGDIFYTCSWNTLTEASGQAVQIRTRARDLLGNIATSPIRTFIVDTAAPLEPPIVEVIYPIGQISVRNTQNLSVRIKAIDEDTGVNNTRIDLTRLNGTGFVNMQFESGSQLPNEFSFWNITTTINGTTGGFRIDYTVNDSSIPQNQFASNFPVVIDNRAPTFADISRSPDDPIYNNTNVSFQLAISDNFRLERFIFSNNFSGTWENITVNVTGNRLNNFGYNTSTLTTGTYGWYFIIFDNAGNVNETAEQSITILAPAPTDINITLISPIDFFNTTSSIVTFEYNYTGATANTCSLFVDSLQVNSTVSPPIDTILSFINNIADGYQHDWSITCNNTDGFNFGSDTRFFTVDTTNPNITLISPPNNTFINISANNFTANITDNVGLSNATLTIINATDNIVNETSIQFGGELQVTVGIVVSLVDGFYKWFYKAFDLLGNSFTSQNNTLTIDTINPAIQFVAPTEASGVTRDQAFIDINVSVIDINLANITIRLYNSTHDLIRENVSTTSPFFISYTSLGLGLYFYNASTTDLAGNINSTETRNITLEIIPPQIQFVAPTEASGVTRKQNNIIVNVTASDDIGIDTITIQIFNTTDLVYINTSSTSPFFVNANNFADGLHFYNATVNDTGNNLNFTETRNITLDTTGPRVFNLRPPPGSKFFQNTSIEIAANVTDEFSVVDTVLANVTLPNGTIIVVPLNNIPSTNRYNNSFSITDLFGRYNITYFANDSLGNNNSTRTSFFTIALDPLNPLIEFVAPTPANNTISTTPSVPINISVNESNLKIVELDFNGTIYQFFPENISVFNDTTLSFTPPVSALSHFINIDTQVGYSFLKVSHDIPGAGTFEVRLNGVFLGEIEKGDPSPILFDDIGDFIVVGSNNITYNRIFPTNAQITLSNITYQKQVNNLFINISLIEDGRYKYIATANDTSDNVNSTELRTYTLDTTNPNATILLPLNNSFSNISNVNFTLNATDNLGIKNLTLNITNSTDGVVNITTIQNTDFTIIQQVVGIVVNLADGLYKWRWTVYDWADNFFTTDTRTFTVDTISPNIQFVAPTEASGVTRSRDYIEINVTVIDAAFENVTIRLYNSSNDLIRENVSLSQPFYINYSELSNGIYFYNASSIDSAGNTNSTETRNITLDTLLPQIQFVSPTEASGVFLNRNNILINVTATDINLANITIFLYNATALVNVTTTITSPNFVNITGLTEGIYFFNATATDAASNINFTETRNVTIDTISPQIQFVAPTEASGVTRSRDYIEINVTASDINFANVTIRLYNSTHAQIQINTSILESFYINYSGLAEGLYFYNASSTDLAGNTNSTETRNITLDTTPPQFSNLVENPASPTTYAFNKKYEFNATWTDVGAVDTVNIEFDGFNRSVSKNGNVYNFTIQNLAAGTYSYYWWANDTIGNFNSTPTFNYVINKATPAGTITLTPSSTVTYPTSTTATGTESNNGDGDVVYTLFRDNSPVPNPNIVTLAAGTYSYKFNATEGENYTAANLDNKVLTVNQGTGVVHTHVNNLRQNINIVTGATIPLNGTLITGVGDIQLYNNGTPINEGQSPLSNLTTFNDDGVFNITTTYAGNQNFTSAFETWFVTVSAAPPPVNTTCIGTQDVNTQSFAVSTRPFVKLCKIFKFS